MKDRILEKTHIFLPTQIEYSRKIDELLSGEIAVVEGLERNGDVSNSLDMQAEEECSQEEIEQFFQHFGIEIVK